MLYSKTGINNLSSFWQNETVHAQKSVAQPSRTRNKDDFGLSLSRYTDVKIT